MILTDLKNSKSFQFKNIYKGDRKQPPSNLSTKCVGGGNPAVLVRLETMFI